MLPQITQVCLDALIRKTGNFKLLKQIKSDIKKALRKMSKASSQPERYEARKQLQVLKQELKSLEGVSVQEVLDECQVICCTNAGAGEKIF